MTILLYYSGPSFQGVELGGAIKNVIALGAGMCEGLGLGMNAMSSLVTRGCMEMGRYFVGYRFLSVYDKRHKISLIICWLPTTEWGHFLVRKKRHSEDSQELEIRLEHV